MKGKFERGAVYRVQYASQPKKVLRIFTGTEKRYSDMKILCYCFTSKVSKDTVGGVRNGNVFIRGKTIPTSEVSIPHYDLISAEKVKDPIIES